jgi:hypothetical protein
MTTIRGFFGVSIAIAVLTSLNACGGGGDAGGAGASGISLQQAYIKASNTGAGDFFGGSVALSGDGNTLAVGVTGEASAATGIGGDQADNTAADAGAVYVFTRSGATWVQQAYLKASNTGAGDSFGGSVALSNDGNTLAVGAKFEGSAATGIGGNQANNTAAQAGAVYIFTRSGTAWSQQAYVKASNTGAGDGFGFSLALSGDGNTLAVGTPFEASAATGVGGNQADNTAFGAGAVYVFTRSGTTWTQQAYVKASNTGASDIFGFSVALSGDGNTLAVGAYLEDSAATGIGGNEADNSASSAGAVYVFSRNQFGVWGQRAYVKASNTGAFDEFGASLALSGDGNTLAVGAPAEDSAATGVGGNEVDNTASFAGAVYVFTRSGTAWAQQAYVKASNTGTGDEFGTSIALSSDGNTLAVGAIDEDSASTGVGGDQVDNTASGAGAVYVFTRSGTHWVQRTYVKASNANAGDQFGSRIALSGAGSTLAVGAPQERNAATGVGADQNDNSAASAGAVYVFQ